VILLNLSGPCRSEWSSPRRRSSDKPPCLGYALPGTRRCFNCRSISIAYLNERREKLNGELRCIVCGKAKENPFKDRCGSCSAKEEGKRAELHAERQAKGLCRCGRPPREGKKTCEVCAKRFRDNARRFYYAKGRGLKVAQRRRAEKMREKRWAA
jgi:hypothetical protein